MMARTSRIRSRTSGIEPIEGRFGLTLMSICSESDCEKPVDRDGVCFRHRVLGVGFNWSGGGYTFGRRNFSAMTNGEFLRRNIGDPNHESMSKVSTRKELI